MTVDNEIDVVQLKLGEDGTGLTPASIGSRTIKNLDELLDKVSRLTESAALRMKDEVAPDELEIEFAFAFTAGTKVLICTEAEASVKVRVLWRGTKDAVPGVADPDG